MPGTTRTAHLAPFCSRPRRRLATALGVFFFGLFTMLAPGPLAGQPFEVEGRVEAAEGGVPRGATAELVPARTSLQRVRRELGDPAEGRELPSRVRTGVGPDGSFRLLAPEPGFWVVRIEAPGRISLVRDPVLLRDLRILDTAVLPPAEELGVVVTDSAGRPVSEARVEVRPAEPWREHRLRSFKPARRRAVTGADGRARLSRAVGEDVLVRAFRPGGPESSEVRVSADEPVPEEPLEIVLPEGAPRRLTVRRADGRPAAGFGVRLGEWSWPAAVTDDEGGARIRVGSAKPRLEIVSPEGWTTRLALDPAAAGDAVEIRLPPPVEITGTVVDQDTREPLAGAWVWLGSERRKVLSPPVTTDRTGGFLLQVAPAKEVRVYAAALGHQPWRFDRPVEDGRVENLRIRLPKALVIRGRVVDGAGEPVAGGDVRVRPVGLRSLSWEPGRLVLRAETGPEGRFRIAARAAQMLDLRAEAEGFAPTELRREREELADPVEIVLRPGAGLTGRAVDPEGKPLEGVEVTVFRAREPGSYRVSRDRRIVVRRSTTGPEGTFLVEHLPTGTFDVELKGTGRAPRLLPGVDPSRDHASGGRAESGQLVDLGDLVLRPGAGLEGRVVDPDGRPVAEGEVLVGEHLPGLPSVQEPPPGLRRREATTDDEGRFRVEDLPPGQRVTVWADGPGHLPAGISGVEPPTEEPLEIRLQRGVRLFGRVLDPEGAPVARADVQVSARLRDEGKRQYHWFESRVTEEDGLFEFDAVPRAELSVAVTALRLAPARRELSTESGQDLGPVEIRLESGAVVEGRVLDPVGAPVAGAHVNVARRTEERYRPLRKGDRTGPGGAFKLVGVPVGRIRLSAFHGEREAREEIDLDPGGAVVDLVLEPARGLRGRVVNPEGRPVEDAMVEIHPVGGRGGAGHSRTSTDPLGRFRFDVDPGDYRLTAFGRGFAPTVVEPLRVEEELRRIEIRLERGVELTGRLLGLAPEELSEVHVQASPRDGGPGQGGRVSFGGDYRIAGLTPGVWRVEASLEGRSARGTVHIRKGDERAALDLEFSEGYTLTGVLLRNGEPLSDIPLQVVPVPTGPAGMVAGSFPTATTGRRGRFRFRGLEPGEYHLWGTDPVTGWRFERRVEVPGDRDLRIETWVTRVTGTLVDAAGEPVDGARLRMQRLTSEPGGSSRWTEIHTEEGGRFVLPAVEEGTWRLVFRAEGHGARVEEIEVSGTEMDLGTLVLEAGAQLVVEPRLVTGEVPETILLAILDPVTSQPVAQEDRPVDPDGRARFQGLPTGSWKGVVTTAESVPVPVSLEISEAGSPPRIPVVLEPRTELRVDVPELVGAGLAARAAVRDAEGENFDFFGLAPSLVSGTWPVMDGQLRIPVLPAGSWTVEITAEDGRVWTATATTRPGEPTVLVLE